MLNHREGTYLAAVRQMLGCCRDIQELLSQDKEHFRKNDFPTLDASNQKKLELLTQINTLTENIKTQQQVDATYGAVTPEISQLVSELKNEIAACYQAIITNSAIVFTNLQQLKDLWDKLLACNAGDDCVYNDKGGIK